MGMETVGLSALAGMIPGLSGGLGSLLGLGGEAAAGAGLAGTGKELLGGALSGGLTGGLSLLGGGPRAAGVPQIPPPPPVQLPPFGGANLTAPPPAFPLQPGGGSGMAPGGDPFGPATIPKLIKTGLVPPAALASDFYTRLYSP